MDEIGSLESFAADLIAGLEPDARKALARDLARQLRTRQQKRIADQQNPDGSAFAQGDVLAELDPAFAIPPALRAQMESGLIAFVEGRLQRKFWSPRQDLDLALGLVRSLDDQSPRQGTNSATFGASLRF